MLRIISVVAQRALMLLSLVLLSGCYTIAQSEYENFTAQPVDKRILNDIQLSWDIKPDATDFCAKILKSSQIDTGSTPVACAIWTVVNKHCTIITTPNPNHVVLGHELRHCFEGKFH